MMRVLRYLVLFSLLMLGLGAVSQAQTPVPGTIVVEYSNFGTGPLVRRPAGETITDSAALEISLTYEDVKSFDYVGDFGLLVDFADGSYLDDQHSEVNAQLVDITDLITPDDMSRIIDSGQPVPSGEVCHVQTDPLGYMERFAVAHAIAHCVLQSATAGRAETDDWWFEGAAEFITANSETLLVEPELFSRAAPDELLFLVGRDGLGGFPHALTSAESDYTGFGSFYFWQFLAATTFDDVEDTLRFIVAMAEASRDEEDYQIFLDEELPDATATMSQFGVALATDTLLAQPSSEDLFNDTGVGIPMPHTEHILADNNFAVQFRRFPIFWDAPAVRVSVNDLPEDSGAAIMVNGDGIDYVPLTPGAPLSFCIEDNTEISAVITRAYGDDDLEIELTFEEDADNESCGEEETEDTEDGEEDQSCLVGAWKLGPLSEDSATIQQFLDVFGSDFAGSTVQIENMTFVYNEDGSFTHSVEHFYLTVVSEGIPPVTVDIAIGASGNMTVRATSLGFFDVQNITYSFDQFRATIIMNGMELDATSIIQGLEGSMRMPPARFECSSGVFLIYIVEMNGQEIRWTYYPMDG